MEIETIEFNQEMADQAIKEYGFDEINEIEKDLGIGEVKETDEFYQGGEK